MSTHDHELLSQYIDGELSPEHCSDLQQRLQSEPALADAYTRMQRIHATLVDSYGHRHEEALPGHIAQLLAQDDAKAAGDNVVAFPVRNKLGWQFALAASLVMALGVVLVQNNTSPESSAGQLVLGDKPLSDALESIPSAGEGWERIADGRNIRPVLTFPSRDGQWCREFLLSEAGSEWRGVACREDGEWLTQAIARETFLSDNDAYRPAGAADSDKIAGFIRHNAADIALSGKAEKNLIKRGWK